MCRAISISNRKGGSGKTTTAVNVAAALAHRGRKVLIVDLDPQAHTTLSLGVRERASRGGVHSVLAGSQCIPDALTDTYLESLKLLPGSRHVAEFERLHAESADIRTLLRDRLAEDGESFDYVVFDTPPLFSCLTISALVASSEVYVPMQAHFLGLEGLAAVVRLVRAIRGRYARDLDIRGVIPTFFRESERLGRRVVAEVRKSLGESIVLHPIRVNVALAEAPSHGQTIFQYNLKSNGARDYYNLAGQIEEIA